METQKLDAVSSRRNLCLLCGVIFYLIGCQFPNPRDASKFQKVDNFTLLDAQGNSHEFYRLKDKQFIVLAAHASNCPLQNETLQKMTTLQERWAKQNVEFLFINTESTLEHDKWLSTKIPILKDEAQIIIPGLGFKRAGDIVVVQPGEWKVAYTGTIDSLELALRGLTENSPLPTSTERPSECSIKTNTVESSFKQIAPLIEQKCLICHHPGGAKPENMTTALDLRGWAPMIREVLRKNLMPPWPLDTKIGHFMQDSSLTPDEKRQIVAWVESGAPIRKGSDPEKLNVPNRSKFQPSRLPDELFGAREVFSINASSPPQYKTYFLGKVDKLTLVLHLSANDGFNRSLAHHYALMITDKPLGEKELAGMNVPDGAEQIFLLPNRFTTAPEGTYFRLPAKSYLYLRAHYEGTGKTEAVQPELKIWHHLIAEQHKSEMKPVKIQHIYRNDLFIPARSIAKVLNAYRCTEDISLFAIAVHMHNRGSAIRITAHLPDGQIRPIISIPAFSLDRQNYFTLTNAIDFPAKTEFRVEGKFDNTNTNPINPNPNVDVRFGPSLSDEMFAATLFYTSSNLATVRRK